MSSLRKTIVLNAMTAGALALTCGSGFPPGAAVYGFPTIQESRKASDAVGLQQPQEQQSQEQPPREQQPQDPQAPLSNSDESIFRNLIPGSQLAFLDQFNGAPSGDLVADARFRKLMGAFVPDCMFHYGRDMPLDDALNMVLPNSRVPVRVRDGRYLTVSGNLGPYLGGRAYLWIDLREGIGLGGFYFRPINGEPTPVLNVFSRQVRDEPLAMSQLPPAFAEDLSEWSAQAGVAPLLARYFITGANRKILLEHDEDYCARAGGAGWSAA